MANIVTTEDVQNTTTVSVARDGIARAQQVIDLVCGRSLDEIASLDSRDQNRLKLAVCYQAAWMDGHPEIYSTINVEAVTQDDLAVRFREDQEAQLIAPLARACITRLSWRGGMTSFSTRSVFQSALYQENWKPMFRSIR